MISIIIFICSGIFSGIVFSQPVKVTDETFLLLKKVSESVCSKGEIILSVTTHQDMGWIDEVEKCIIMRDTLWMTPYLERLRYDPEFCMDIEQVSIIVEYLNRHPDKKEEIQKGLDEGRILVGATFTQPYEDMYSGESLIRQFYLGKKWLKQNFNGFNSDTYFNADVPGRTLQMAQILARAGVSNMLATRHEKGLFDWYSPDGSKVTMYSSGHYIDFYNILKKKNEEALAGMAREVLFWGNYYDTNSEKIVIPAHLNYEFIWDQEPVRNCYPFISLWNSVRVVENQNGERLAVKLPPFRYGNLNDCMNIMRANASTVEKIEGERPSLWLYIHGPSHHYAITASRNADILLPDAEKFSAIDAMLGGNFRQYDQDRFNEAWQAKIYPDHGWGGKGGESTDAIFLARFEKSLSDARSIANQALISIASKIKANRKKGIPVVVFNSLSWKRDDPVTFNIGFDPGQAFDITLVDADGKNIPVQLTDIERYSDKSLKNTNATFIAKGIPPIGYKTFYVVPGNTVPDVKKPGNNNYETLFYKIVLGKGGVKSIFDKELNIELLNCKNIFVGDIFTMKSVGNGAAEFADIQQPEMEGFDKVSNHSPGWEIEETGPVFTSFKMRQPIRNAVAETHLIIYNNLKKIDFKTALLNWEGVLYREYRFAMPLNMKNGKVAYEVPFGVLEVGKDEISGAAGERYRTECSMIHPRGIENWIGASDDRIGVTLSSSTAVADYIDPTGLSPDALLLQPILLASLRSCHGLGNEYLQTGDHYFNFSLTSHKPGYENGSNFGRQANEKLLVVVDPQAARSATLTEETSFFSVNAQNISISAIKKAEDDNNVVIRLYESSIGETEVSLYSWFKISSAERTNMVEYDGKVIESEMKSVPLKIGSHSIETIKISFN